MLISGFILLFIYFEHAGRHRPPPEPEQTHKAPQNVTLTGTVLNYGSNRAGDIDKMLLHTNDNNVWIHFPPHTAGQVIRLAPEHSNVHITASIHEQHLPDNAVQFELVCILSDVAKRSFYPHDVPPPPPAPGKEVELSGSSVQFKKNDAGEVSGFILQHKFIALDPHHIRNLLPLLQQAGSIVVKGYERNDPAGFVNVSGLTLIKPYSITIDKTAYRLQ